MSELPLPPGQKMVYLCHDNKTVVGPEPIDEVAEKVLDRSYSADVAILAEGSQDWTTFAHIRETWPSPRMVALLRQRVAEQEQAANDYLAKVEAEVAAVQKKETDKVGAGCAAAIILVIFCIALYCFLTWLGSPHSP